mgnify:FL=1
MKILVVEDEHLISDAVCKIFADAGWFTDAVYDGDDALYYIKEGSYDLILLDVMLPGTDGLTVLRQLRRDGVNTPVLMLTAKNTLPDKLSGLNGGADDYMTKPFDAEELLARVRALTRRTGAVVLNELHCGDLTLTLDDGVLHCGDATVRLTKKELEVLEMLMKHPKMTVTKGSLIENVWGIDSEATDNNVEAYISFLRRKLKFVGSTAQIKNAQGLGYRLEADAC